MEMARIADAPVVLVADIDRGSLCLSGGNPKSYVRRGKSQGQGCHHQ